MVIINNLIISSLPDSLYRAIRNFYYKLLAVVERIIAATVRIIAFYKLLRYFCEDKSPSGTSIKERSQNV